MSRWFNPPTKKRGHRPDFWLIGAIGLLLILSLVVIYSMNPVLSHKLTGQINDNYFIIGQLRNIGVGLVLLVAASLLHWRWWEKLDRWVILLAGVATLLLLVDPLTLTEQGATRWLEIGGISFQPSEAVKLALVLGTAHYLSRQDASDLGDKRKLLYPALGLLAVLSLFVVVLQKDLGTMVIIAAILVGMMFIRGTSLKQLGLLVATGLGGGILSIVLFPHRMERLATFLHPSSDLAASGYHIHQALIAIGSGGLSGLGLGKSIQVYGYLPEAANDSIFAIVAETFGFLGSVSVLLLIGFVIWRIIRVSRQAPSVFSSLVALGIGLWLGAQTLVNVAAMLGIIPLTGIPLPFLSYGGSSLVVTMTALGIVVNISKYTNRKESHARTAKRRRHGRSHHTNSGRRRSAQTA